LTAEEHQSQQQQQQQQQQQAVKSTPWHPLQYLQNVNVGRRRFIGELSMMTPLKRQTQSV